MSIKGQNTHPSHLAKYGGIPLLNDARVFFLTSISATSYSVWIVAMASFIPFTYVI